MARERLGVRGTRLDAHHNSYGRDVDDEGVFDLLVALCTLRHTLFHEAMDDAS